jgi:hypothetical protein
MRRFLRKHRYIIRIFAYISLVIAAYALGKFSITRSYIDMFLFIVFVVAFLPLKIYEKTQF